MQIVIDVPEEKLNIIKNKIYCGIYDSDLYKIIANGTPLSKAHDNKDVATAFQFGMAFGFAKKCDDCVLDKIRAEIERPIIRDEYSQRQNDYCDGYEFVCKRIADIIDKHITKSEDK